MRKTLVLVALGILLLSNLGYADNGQYYFKFEIKDRTEINKLTRIISIDNVIGDQVYAYANEIEFARFVALGYDYEILPDPSSLYSPEMATTRDGMRDWDTYPTFDAYVQMMEDYAANYPSLCILDTIGFSVQGRELLVCRISDNVGTEENEPEVMYTATMHGDETAGYVLTLRLIDYLLTNYGTDTQVTNMVDEMEIWINPLANPDGTYAGGNHTLDQARRTNANYVDLNRNYPDPEDGPNPDGNIWQAETIAFMAWADAHSFVISSNFHGGAEVVNYPWDTWIQRHADDSWWIQISRLYADSAQANSPYGYLTDQNNGITNGYDWYTIAGGRQDYMNYWHGCREMTLELSHVKKLAASQLPAHWDYNRAAFLNYLENALYGIRGVVTDAQSGLPVFATVTTLNHDIDSSRVFTDPDVGNYHRMLDAGTYDLEFSAPGYYSDTVKNIFVTDFGIAVRDVQLQPMSDEPILTINSHDANNIQPGDTVAMYITLLNSGAGNATGVNATLSTSDGDITVSQDISSYPSISALGGTGISNSEYEFIVSQSTPLLHLINFRLDLTADGGYKDSAFFSVMVGQQIETFETGDFTAYEWQMGGSQNWSITSGGVEGGSYCARSGSISHSQSTELYIDVEVTAAGEISFYYKVSSEVDYDYLKFFIDGGQQNQWAGEIGWTQVSYPVSSGPHTFKWTYTKDGSLSSGSDCGWVDYIIFPPIGGEALEIITNSLPDWTVDQYYSQQLEATGGSGTITWTDLYGDLAGTGLSLSTSGLLSGTPTATGEINFTAHAQDEGKAYADKPFSFTINPAVVITTESMPGGTVGTPYSNLLQASGGTGIKSWTDKNNDLAGYGLALSTSGNVTGTPTSSGTVSFTAHLEDITGSFNEKLLDIEIAPDWLCGDCDGNGVVEVSDAVYILDYIFTGGPAPDPIESGDPDCTTVVEISDVVYLITYIFNEGPEPCAECPQ